MSQELILIIEDDETFRHMLSTALGKKGYVVKTAKTAEDGLKACRQEAPDLIISDIKLPGMDGLQFLKELKKDLPKINIILITGYATVETAVKAMQQGAYSYISKPFKIEEILINIRKALAEKELREDNIRLQQEVQKRYKFSQIIGKSKSMQEIFHKIEKVAKYDTPILIIGRTGTGKELVAKAIHYNSPRRNKPFLAINCGAIPINLLESEIFGYAKGAFTDATKDKKGLMEEASGSTFFLDEIGELPLALQAKLLRSLEESEIRRLGDTRMIKIDVRFIAATSKDLMEETRKGTFRNDLYYRLNVVPINLPPLCERKEDIPLLVNYFMGKSAAETKKKISPIPAETMKILVNYEWPGNVRELENVIERAIIMDSDGIITREDIPTPGKDSDSGTPSHRLLREHFPPENTLILKDALSPLIKKTEAHLIKKALAKANDNRTETAKILGISRRSLMYKLKKMKMTE